MYVVVAGTNKRKILRMSFCMSLCPQLTLLPRYMDIDYHYYDYCAEAIKRSGDEDKQSNTKCNEANTLTTS